MTFATYFIASETSLVMRNAAVYICGLIKIIIILKKGNNTANTFVSSLVYIYIVSRDEKWKRKWQWQPLFIIFFYRTYMFIYIYILYKMIFYSLRAVGQDVWRRTRTYYIVVILKVIYGVVGEMKFNVDSRRCWEIILLGTYCGGHLGIIFAITFFYIT